MIPFQHHAAVAERNSQIKKKDRRHGCKRGYGLQPEYAERLFWSSWQPLDSEERQEWHLSGHEELPQMCNRPLIGLADKTAMSRGQAKDISAAQHGQSG